MGVGRGPPGEIQMNSRIDTEAEFHCLHGVDIPQQEMNKNQSLTCKAQQMQNQDGFVAVFSNPRTQGK